MQLLLPSQVYEVEMIAAPKTRSKYSCAQLEFQATALTMEQKLSSVRTLSAAMWPGRNQKAHCGLQRNNKHVLRMHIHAQTNVACVCNPNAYT